MSTALPRPDPISADEARFWSFVAAGELRIQQCADCRTFRHPPRPLCAACASTNVAWVVASGRGEVWATTIIHPPTLAAFAARTPYAAIVVRLDENVYVVSNLIDCAPDDVAIGMRVEVSITEVEPGLHLPLFRVAR